jgi:hypothetical protein
MLTPNMLTPNSSSIVFSVAAMKTSLQAALKGHQKGFDQQSFALAAGRRREALDKVRIEFEKM